MSETEKVQPLALIDSSIGSKMWIIMKVSVDGMEGLRALNPEKPLLRL